MCAPSDLGEGLDTLARLGGSWQNVHKKRWLLLDGNIERKVLGDRGAKVLMIGVLMLCVDVEDHRSFFFLF